MAFEIKNIIFENERLFQNYVNFGLFVFKDDVLIDKHDSISIPKKYLFPKIFDPELQAQILYFDL